MDKFEGKILILFAILSASALFLFSPSATRAYQIEKLSDVPVSGDLVLYQAKTEIALDAGENAGRSIALINRSGQDLSVSVSVEDFSASVKADQNIELLGAQTGFYSLKDYLKPEATTFTLRHGEKIILPINIRIPQNAQPGGLYGAVIFSARLSEEPVVGSSNVQTIPRLASLFFVRVNGEVRESGALVDFSSAKTFYFRQPVSFEFNYKNDGSVYLNPYGELNITNIFGRTVQTKLIPPYFVLTGAVRQQKETLESKRHFGMYRATLRLNRGYGNNIDQKSLYFFVLPIPYLIGAAVALALLGILIWRMKTAFKKPKNP